MHMLHVQDWFKQLCLSWTLLSAAAVCVSCQELTSTLREGNRACPGEEVIFTCTIRGPSSLQVIAVAWSSAEYIGQGSSLQLSTANMIGAVETSTDMDGNITATATVTNNTNVNGELVLESTLNITAVMTSVVTCSGINGFTASIGFTVSAVPGIPQRIRAAEISRPSDGICIILVTWDPPANSDASVIDQYIVYVPSRNIRDDTSSSTISTLTVSNCGDNIRIRIAAVNSIGCVGMNSSEVQPILLDNIPATTTKGGCTSTSTVPGIPQRIRAAEISRPSDGICIILVTWDPPANSDASDIDQYIVYVPSRNIRDDTSSSTISTLTMSNCSDDIRVQVAAVNRIGCVGMNSSEVQPILLDIPATSTKGGCISTSKASLLTPVQAGTGAANVFLSAITILIVCAIN